MPFTAEILRSLLASKILVHKQLNATVLTKWSPTFSMNDVSERYPIPSSILLFFNTVIMNEIWSLRSTPKSSMPL